MLAQRVTLPTLGYQKLLWLCPDSSLLNMELSICEEVTYEFQNHGDHRVHLIDHIPAIGMCRNLRQISLVTNFWIVGVQSSSNLLISIRVVDFTVQWKPKQLILWVYSKYSYSGIWSIKINVPLETRWDWFPAYDLLNHRVKRIYLLWQVKQKF